jgi:2-succinyl-6-hydroxy-2,4-cyclohexadiene-1-carboxylate synthase
VGVIWCLHGFLGLPSDWDILPFPHRAPNLFHGEPVAAKEDDTLIGYSMGGRLALYHLLRQRVAKAVIVSAGITAYGDERRRADEEWARRFETEEWSSLMQAWHAQPLFGGHALDRQQVDFDRAALARALREWSPAVLEPLAPRLHEIETPILWIAGERDTKYVAEAERALALLPHAELWICPEAGHRVPWERTEAFVERLRAWLDLH